MRFSIARAGPTRKREIGRWRVVAAFTFVGLVAGCAGSSEGESGWRDAEGRPLPSETINTFRGPEHCGWESATFLTLAWPLGSTAKSAYEARQYVRDVEGVFASEDGRVRGLLSSFQVLPRLPAAARSTGFHTDDEQLWIVPKEADRHVYLVRGGVVERWPRTTGFACA